jgi:hypothetical protein
MCLSKQARGERHSHNPRNDCFRWPAFTKCKINAIRASCGALAHGSPQRTPEPASSFASSTDAEIRQTNRLLRQSDYESSIVGAQMAEIFQQPQVFGEGSYSIDVDEIYV